MTFENNNSYKLVHTAATGEKFYIPVDLENGYHLSRKIAAEAQELYSASGTTKEVLQAYLEEILTICNAESKKNDKVRTEIGLLVNSMQYRMRYPVDEDCALRMAAIYLFIEGEDPNQVSPTYTEQKTRIAKADPDTYAFFLTIGVESTSSWKEYTMPSSIEDYLKRREETLETMKRQKD